MIWARIAWKFLKRYRKTIVVAIVLGGIIVGVASLFGAWQIERGLRISLEAQIVAVEIEAQIEHDRMVAELGKCVEANKAWADVLEEWQRQANEMRMRADAYAARIADLEFEHVGIEMQRDELEARIAAITATDCDGAVDQLIDVLGWGAR